MLYANYLRNKMRHLVKTIFASGYPLKLISKFKKKAVDYTIHGNTETGKNLIPYPYVWTNPNTGVTTPSTTKTTAGITFTDNGDGTITANGTATANALFYFDLPTASLSKEVYCLSGCPTGGGTNKYYINISTYNGNTGIGSFLDTGTGKTVDLSDKDFTRFNTYIIIFNGVTVNNLVFKPQFEIGETATEYEPYIEYGVGDKTKNLIPYPYDGFEGLTTKTLNGIIFTDNGDGTIAINGTTDNDDVRFRFITSEIKLPSDSSNYVLSGKADNTAYVYTVATGANNAWYQMLPSSIFDTVNTDTYNTLSYMDIICVKNSEFNNIVIKPQLEIGETATEYEPYGYKIPLVNTGKNLIPYPYYETTKTVNGITYTDNGDGTITVNGTATADAHFYLSEKLFLPAAQYIITTGTTSQNTVLIHAAELEGSPDENGNYILLCELYVPNGATANNILIKPMIAFSGGTAEYEPYREPYTTTIYHTEQLKDGESIRYKNDKLPDLQLYKGENNITVDTKVKPSVIDVKYLN